MPGRFFYALVIFFSSYHSSIIINNKEGTKKQRNFMINVKSLQRNTLFYIIKTNDIQIKLQRNTEADELPSLSLSQFLKLDKLKIQVQFRSQY